MYIYKLPRQKFSQDGKGILRSLQNDNLPLIDLVIREAFQNSLDATKPGVPFTLIDVFTNDFQTSKIATHFEGLESELNRRFDENQKVLIIQDKNTFGLQGVIDERTATQEELELSNFYKLVYGLSMNQEGEGKGGSWGLGKTSFFRIGIGVVVYYTRVKLDNETYEERLAASLIEDPKSQNALIDSSLGIAWWGGTSDIQSASFETYPITDKDSIHDFLSDFGVPTYVGDETGTTIIIPFIDSELLASSEEDTKRHIWWDSSFEDSINLAIQRWYGSRIMNEDYSSEQKQSYLMTSVNGKYLNPLEFETTFKWFYRLYNAALNKKSPTQDSPIQVSKIVIPRDALNNPSDAVGYVAFAKVTNKDLGLDNDLSPFVYVHHNELDEKQDKGRALLAYSRKPGMVIEYVTEDSPWFKNVNLTDDTFILAYFVPMSDAKLRSSYQENYSKKYVTLESYLRDTEHADHAEWIDKTYGKKRITIVNRIQRYTASAMSKAFTIDDGTQIESHTSALQRKFGEILLPPLNFGKGASGGSLSRGNKNNRTSNKKRTSNIIIRKSIPISDKTVQVEFEAYLHREGFSDIRFDILSTDGLIDERSWIKDMGGVAFPFEILSVNFSKLNEMDFDLKDGNIDDLNIVEKPHGLVASILIESKFKEGLSLSGSFELLIKDKTMIPDLVVRQSKITSEEDK